MINNFKQPRHQTTPVATEHMLQTLSKIDHARIFLTNTAKLERTPLPRSQTVPI
jgi:hypothetical protein